MLYFFVALSDQSVELIGKVFLTFLMIILFPLSEVESYLIHCNEKAAYLFVSLPFDLDFTHTLRERSDELVIIPLTAET